MTKNLSTTFTIRSRITGANRVERAGHKGGVLWFTGLPGAGKSTLAVELEWELFNRGYSVYVLDGDNLRTGLCSDLKFSHADRTENIRRVGELAALFADAGTIVISAIISPYRADRHQARNAVRNTFHEVYVKADIATCEKRDPKGLYRRARRGEISNFTGISAPYEVPVAPDLIIDTVVDNVRTCTNNLITYVSEQFGSNKVK